MFDNDFDPYETLKCHDNWIAEMATNVESLAGSGANMAKVLENQQNLIRHLTVGFQYQHRLIMALNERLEQLEKK